MKQFLGELYVLSVFALMAWRCPVVVHHPPRDCRAMLSSLLPPVNRERCLGSEVWDAVSVSAVLQNLLPSFFGNNSVNKKFCGGGGTL